MRRVVTGHRNGKSVILEDAEIPGQGRFGSEMAGLWKTEGVPTIPLDEGDLKKHFPFQFPKPGETYLNLAVVAPQKEYLKEAKENGVDVVGEWRKNYGDDYGMHTSDTIDYDIILSGEVWMEIDGGVEVQLKAGDCVIQNGTRHAWRNKSSKDCVMASIMIGAKREKGAG